jgi:hypothetical protein
MGKTLMSVTGKEQKMSSTMTLEANTGIAYLRPVHIELISMALKREGGFGLKPAWVEEGTTAKIEFDGLESDKAITLANAAVVGSGVTIAVE